jgi:hypothetical protein
MVPGSEPQNGGMAQPTPSTGRSGRWLAVIWVLGTVAAIAVSVGAVRLAGAQVTVRHPPPLTRAEVASAVAVERSSDDNGSAGSSDDTAGVDDHGSSSDDSVSGGPGPSGSSGPGSGGSGDGGSGSGTSGGGSDDKGGSSPTSGPSGGSGSGDSGSGGSSGPGGGSDDGGSSGPGGGHDSPTSTTVPPAAVFSKSTTGGAVTVRCTGDTVALVSAPPAAGWTVDLRNSGPQEVEVRFETKDDDARIKARCSASVVSWSS